MSHFFVATDITRIAKFEILTTVIMKLSVFWYMRHVDSSVVEEYVQTRRISFYSEHTKGNCYTEQEHVFDQFPKYLIKI
jgi:hypothetical protein